jgi:hypothetical protein
VCHYPDGVQAPPIEQNFRSGNSDPMIRSRRVVALEPVRVVVELRREEFQALSKASGRVAPADYLKLLALRLAGLSEAP